MKQIIDRIIEVINNVARDIEAGSPVVREIRPQELQAVWTNINTKQEYAINSNATQWLITQIKNGQNDPRLIPCLQFIANQITGLEAKKTIDRLEKLKAFW